MEMVTLDLAPTRRRPALITNEALAAISGRCESAPATEIVAWAVDHFGSDLVVATSFQDAVLIDVVTSVAPDVEFAFIDTGFHFPETLAYVETVRDRYDLRLSVISAGLDPRDSPCGSATCCRLRKVEPLIDFLADRSAWMSGLRRDEAPTRAAAPIVAWDAEKRSVKVNPLANWSDHEVTRYAQVHGLPEHPLRQAGYLSIGCAPTTVPVQVGEDPRSGRWAGSDKTECGLHI
jgi:phosphoadenosine phosphosulfate reductase